MVRKVRKGTGRGLEKLQGDELDGENSPADKELLMQMSNILIHSLDSCLPSTFQC